MKHRLRNSIIILLVTGIMLYLLLKDNFNSIMEVLTSVNPVWIIFAIVIYLIYFVTDTIPFYIYSHNYNNKLRFPFMLYLNAITKFFNGITPLATGGQPMQVYELRKKGTSTANSTNAVTQFYIVFQISLVLWGLIALIFDKAFGMIEMNTVLNIFTILGFVLNIIVLIFLFVISFNKSINKSIVRVIITFLAKLKIVREKEKQIDKWNTTCDEFYENSKVLICEGCTHHRQCDDIGTVKIPKLLEKYTGQKLKFEWTSGADFPDNLEKYDLIIHCGGCMLNDKEMIYRKEEALKKNIPFTNYGIVLAYLNNILDRAVSPFTLHKIK